MLAPGYPNSGPGPPIAAQHIPGQIPIAECVGKDIENTSPASCYPQDSYYQPKNNYPNAPPRPPDVYFPQEPPFMQNTRLFGPIPQTTGEYQRNFFKPDPEAFFGHGCPPNPFVRPTYPHFPFTVQAMTSTAPRMQNPIQCEWVEVSVQMG
ncbi:unnamed protein product [Anisakis simplex]|uniref:Phospholipid scramblase 2-like n=1 Tax=Anisakis simplex TaxID=6269 RepID=A0A0M3KIK1_ANISI|nr:unnamed protein product [Anisakis simplex]